MRHGQECRWLGAAATQPPLESFDGLLAALKVAESKGVANCPFSVVDTDAQLTTLEGLAPEVEGVRIESMPANRGADNGVAASAR